MLAHRDTKGAHCKKMMEESISQFLANVRLRFWLKCHPPQLKFPNDTKRAQGTYDKRR